MNARVRLVAVPLLLFVASSQTGAQPPPFTRQVLTREYDCDGINAGDFNRDGVLDIVAGPYWYEGPSFAGRHEVFPATPQDGAKGQSNSMYSYVYDFNQDGWPDILVLGRVHMHPAQWYENPQGRTGPWPRHFAFERVRGESPPFCDLDGDGKPELIGHWENRWGRIGPDWSDPAKPWSFHSLVAFSQPHALDLADIDGDGLKDIVVGKRRWAHGPAGDVEPGATPVLYWFQLVRGADRAVSYRPHLIDDQLGVGVQVLARDINGDGRIDVLTASKLGSAVYFNQIQPRKSPDVP